MNGLFFNCWLKPEPSIHLLIHFVDWGVSANSHSTTRFLLFSTTVNATNTFPLFYHCTTIATTIFYCFNIGTTTTSLLFYQYHRYHHHIFIAFPPPPSRKLFYHNHHHHHHQSISINLPPLPFFITCYRFIMTTTTTTFLLFSIHRTATATHDHQHYLISIFPFTTTATTTHSRAICSRET